MHEGIRFFVGLDVHEDTIAMSVADTGRTAARLIGTIAHDTGKLRKALARLVSQQSSMWFMKRGRPATACSAP